MPLSSEPGVVHNGSRLDRKLYRLVPKFRKVCERRTLKINVGIMDARMHVDTNGVWDINTEWRRVEVFDIVCMTKDRDLNVMYRIRDRDMRGDVWKQEE